MIVALAIAGLLLGVVPVAASRLYESVEYRATVRELLTSLRQSREVAAREGRSVRFVIDAQRGLFGVAGRPMHDFPEGYRVATQLAATEQQSGGLGVIRFFPDGSSSGGSITVIRPSGQGVRLRVDWLMGRITQERPEGAPS